MSSASGLGIIQSMVDGSASNVRNAETLGGKSQVFVAVPGPTIGGVPSSPILSSFTDISARGAFKPTTREFDVTVEGNGFMAVEKNGQRGFIQTGRFIKTEDSLATADGRNLQGWKYDDTGKVTQNPEKLGNIDLSDVFADPVATTKVDVKINCSFDNTPVFTGPTIPIDFSIIGAVEAPDMDYPILPGENGRGGLSPGDEFILAAKDTANSNAVGTRFVYGGVIISRQITSYNKFYNTTSAGGQLLINDANTVATDTKSLNYGQGIEIEIDGQVYQFVATSGAGASEKGKFNNASSFAAAIKEGTDGEATGRIINNRVVITLKDPKSSVRFRNFGNTAGVPGFAEMFGFVNADRPTDNTNIYSTLNEMKAIADNSGNGLVGISEPGSTKLRIGAARAYNFLEIDGASKKQRFYQSAFSGDWVNNIADPTLATDTNLRNKATLCIPMSGLKAGDNIELGGGAAVTVNGAAVGNALANGVYTVDSVSENGDYVVISTLKPLTPIGSPPPAFGTSLLALPNGAPTTTWRKIVGAFNGDGVTPRKIAGGATVAFTALNANVGGATVGADFVGATYVINNPDPADRWAKGDMVSIKKSKGLNDGIYQVIDVPAPGSITLLARAQSTPPDTTPKDLTALGIPNTNALVDDAIEMIKVGGVGGDLETMPLKIVNSNDNLVEISMAAGHGFTAGSPFKVLNLRSAKLTFAGISIQQGKTYEIESVGINYVRFRADGTSGANTAGTKIGYNFTQVPPVGGPPAVAQAVVVNAVNPATGDASTLGSTAEFHFIGSVFNALGDPVAKKDIDTPLNPTYDPEQTTKNMSSGAIPADQEIPILVKGANGQTLTALIQIKRIAENEEAIEISSPDKEGPNKLVSFGEAKFIGSYKNTYMDPKFANKIAFPWSDGSNASSIKFNLDMTQSAGANYFNVTSVDGNARVGVKRFEITEEGDLVAYYDDGRSKALYNIPIVTTNSTYGLQADSSGMWVPSSKTSLAYVTAGSPNAGKFKPNTIELSTEDATSDVINIALLANRYAQQMMITATELEMAKTATQRL